MAYSVCHAPQIVSDMLSEIHTMEKCFSFKPISHSEITQFSISTGPEVIKPFSCSTELSMKFQMLISMKISRNSAFFRPR